MIENEVRHPGFHDVVGTEVLESVQSGFMFLEGPVWHPVDRTLIFSDIPAGIMYCYDGRRVSVFRDPSNMANGNTYDRSGRLLTCEHATSRVVRTEHDGRVVVVASMYKGLELNSPNDIVVATTGEIYFTDPPFGRRERVGVPRPQQLDFQGVYELVEGAEPTLVADDFDLPNGLCLSVDESILFVNDSGAAHVRRFARSASGFRDLGVWVSPEGDGPGRPDGMKVDTAGNLFCTGPGGIHVFSDDAECLGVIRVPEQTANFGWGDDDLCTLYICASSTLYRCRTRVPGIRLF